MEKIVYDDLHSDLNTSYSFSNNAAGLGSLRRLHMCLLCVYYIVYGPWLTHSIYACVVYLRAETYISICICGSGGYACAFCNHVYSIPASALIYANMYIIKMYVSLKPALKSKQMKHTWDSFHISPLVNSLVAHQCFWFV